MRARFTSALFAQDRFEMVQIVMGKAHHPRARYVGADNDAVVGEFVDENEIVLGLSDQGNVGHVAADQRDRVVSAQNSGKLALQSAMDRALAPVARAPTPIDMIAAQAAFLMGGSLARPA